MPTDGARGRNAALTGSVDGRHGLGTPALLVELGTLERNLALVAAHCAAAGLALRPHVKGNKCPELARRQLAAGAIGLSCTTLAEAELMAATGTPSLLITSPVVDLGQRDRIAALVARVPELVTVADDPTGLAVLAAAAAGGSRAVAVLVDLDVGQKRTGLPVDDSGAIVALAAEIDRTPGLAFAGLQAYYGHLQGLVDHDERAGLARDRQAQIRAAVGALSQAGLPPRIVSGGGTGTFLTDNAGAPFTELQPGSYPFLDVQYGREALTPDARPWLTPSLFVRSRVVSAGQADRVTIDAGMKAVSTDGGAPQVVRPDDIAADYAFAGDEHGFLLLRPGSRRPALGEAVELIPAHCDTTVNLHGAIHAVRGPRLEAVWPIGARGVW